MAQAHPQEGLVVINALVAIPFVIVIGVVTWWLAKRIVP